MNDALGMIEVLGLSTAVEVCDIMVKTADVTLANIERAKGMGWVTVKIRGDVAAVKAAITAGHQVADRFGGYITEKVIPRPVEAVVETFMNEPDPDKRAKDQKPTTPIGLPKAKKEEPKPEPKEEPKAEPKPKAKAPVKAPKKAEPVEEPKAVEAPAADPVVEAEAVETPVVEAEPVVEAKAEEAVVETKKPARKRAAKKAAEETPDAKRQKKDRTAKKITEEAAGQIAL